MKSTFIAAGEDVGEDFGEDAGESVRVDASMITDDVTCPDLVRHNVWSFFVKIISATSSSP